MPGVFGEGAGDGEMGDGCNGDVAGAATELPDAVPIDGYPVVAGWLAPAAIGSGFRSTRITRSVPAKIPRPLLLLSVPAERTICGIMASRI